MPNLPFSTFGSAPQCLHSVSRVLSLFHSRFLVRPCGTGQTYGCVPHRRGQIEDKQVKSNGINKLANRWCSADSALRKAIIQC